ncbi:TIGR00730 family Rossman fold protein [Actinomadura sp. KC345]|uniref:LOG family protein n=1 Tax=Actinomadura sp. KC345 TaxID=2530371 RepID=UPI001FB733CF|nr:TIGR00730 family Rossman fold protein [Actinomadura sp. KC345]
MHDELSTGFANLAGVRRAVTVFGSARTRPGTKEYDLAFDIGARLAEAGYPVITGGGPGVMEGSNKGAKLAGGTSIGVGIVLPMEQRLNDHLTNGWTCRYFFTRKVFFVKNSQAFIVLPGGFGSLDELFEVLTLVQTRKLDKRPIILAGVEFWGGLVAWINEKLLAEGKVSPGDPDLLHVVDTAEEAVEIVKAHVPAS